MASVDLLGKMSLDKFLVTPHSPKKGMPKHTDAQNL